MTTKQTDRREYMRLWREENRERVREYAHQRYLKTRDRAAMVHKERMRTDAKYAERKRAIQREADVKRGRCKRPSTAEKIS